MPANSRANRGFPRASAGTRADESRASHGPAHVATVGGRRGGAPGSARDRMWRIWPVLYKPSIQGNNELALGMTHEGR